MNWNESQQLYSDDKIVELNKTLSASLENKELDLKTLITNLENKVKELQGNVRHITQLGMTWFAFFVTINYLTLGWFARGLSNDVSINPFIISMVALVFIVQNLLGILGIYEVRKTAAAGAQQTSIYENWLLSTNEKWLCDNESEPHIKVLKLPSIPAELYAKIACSLMIVLGSLIGAWALISGYCIFKWMFSS